MKHVLSDIGENDLGQIAALLRLGRLQSPFSSAALSQLSTEHADRLSSFLRMLSEEGMSIPHMVLLLESVAMERRRLQSTEVGIELVTSGPEAPGITNRDTVVVVRELFQNANKAVLIAGYAVYQGKQVFAALARRMEEVPGLTVRMYLDVQRHPTDTSLASEVVSRFTQRFKSKEWPGERLPEIYFDPRSLEIGAEKKASLHAKCIVVDGEVSFISSANFTEAAQIRNIEVGALIRSTQIARKIMDHFEALTQGGVLRRIC